MSAPVTLVTGATGFLGRQLCHWLVARGEPVVAMGRDPARLPALDQRLCRKQVGDLSQPSALAQACRGVDSVIHSAALSTTWGERGAFLETNVAGTVRLLEAARAAGVRRFVHVSSSSVVFDNVDRAGVDERAPYATRYLSPYIESKALAEQAVRAFSRERQGDRQGSGKGMETVILRPRAIFGPGDTSLVPRLVEAGRAGWLPVIGTGDNLQDLTFVDNVVHALALARFASDAPGRTYFISNGEPLRIWDVIFQLFDALSIARPRRRVPAAVAFAAAGVLERLHRWRRSTVEPRLTRYKVALLSRTQTLDISAARRELGYAPMVTMAEALHRTFRELAHA